MTDTRQEQLNRTQLESHLKSAVDTLTPNILDRIDLSTPQDPVPYLYQNNRYHRRMRSVVMAVAACLCVMMMGAGTFHYHTLNQRIDSIIGLDVNPSVELSINKKNKVLEAEALNDEARAVMDGMDLEGVDVNVAVNAVIGSMVTHGYFNEDDNAILVTVTNDSVSKASELRSSIVYDIEMTLEENQVQATVYDQQVIERDEIKLIADQYGVSYGKAYFLKELIDQNDSLSMADMEVLSSMTMEEIAAEIAERSYALGEFADKKAGEEKELVGTVVETSEVLETESSLESETTVVMETEPTTAKLETTMEPTTTEAETQEEVREDKVEIDYVDYEDGCVYVYFVTKVKWKHPTVSVFDEEGGSYSAMVSETSGSECVIEVSDLEGGRSYTFVLGGLRPVEGGGATTVTGYFEKPMIADELETDDDDESETTTAAVSEPEHTSEAETMESSAEESTVDVEAITEKGSDHNKKDEKQENDQIREQEQSEDEKDKSAT